MLPRHGRYDLSMIDERPDVRRETLVVITEFIESVCDGTGIQVTQLTDHLVQFSILRGGLRKIKINTKRNFDENFALKL